MTSGAARGEGRVEDPRGRAAAPRSCLDRLEQQAGAGHADDGGGDADKADHYDLPWLGPRARAAIEYGDDGIAPPAIAGGITLLAAECVVPPLLQAGLWPVHPFAHQALVDLGDQLPFHWRELKQLQRRHLATLGLSHDACNP
ncbi:hypothetical protein [Actinomadura sp. KC216]|uniref:hypothetical protein n=1 Tax=Actinomadura sp. KC216 TaxID=2530370 RepID=UPI001A9D3A2E|nr:hypothetical protein [Actinomadura sp. KC216]